MDWEGGEPMMLPPTVSTYKQNPVYVPPPPDMTVLRRELRESLDEASKHLQELEKGFTRDDPRRTVAQDHAQPMLQAGTKYKALTFWMSRL